MTSDHRESVFESEICAHLEAHGWLYSADDTGYDRERALFPGDLFAWLEETQKPAYEKALRAAGSDAARYAGSPTESSVPQKIG